MGRVIEELHEAALAPRTPGAVHVSATALLFAIGQQSPAAPGADMPGSGGPEPEAPASEAPASGMPGPAGGQL
jgi:hypothetical protein